MKKRPLYIAISILVFLLIGGLIGLVIFINYQQRTQPDTTQDLGYFGGGGGGSSSGGGLFGGLFGGTGSTNDSVSMGSAAKTAEPTLRQLYNLPISGFTKRQGDAVRFVDRATGHIFEKTLPDGATTRINQTTVPRVHNAVFVNDGTAVIRQYVDASERIASVYTRISSSEPGEPFPGSIRDVTVSPDGDQIAILEETSAGSILHIAAQDGSSQQTLFESLLRNWNIQWAGDTILISQKASGSLVGSAFTINVSSGVQRLVLQQLTGLSALLSPDGAHVLYSTTKNGVPVLSVKNLSTGVATVLTGATLAEKCVWHPEKFFVYCAFPDQLPNVSYPDAWYRGEVHFTDSIFRINIESGQTEYVFSPSSTSGTSLDIKSLALHADGSVLFFINATDQTLWSQTVSEVTETGEGIE